MKKYTRIVCGLGAFFLFFMIGVGHISASQTNGTIDAHKSYAWGENMGWINFAATSGNIHITDAAVTGFAWNQNYGWINFSPTQAGVTNTSEGQLGGTAWSSHFGWISFSGVRIDSSGKFIGIAGTKDSTAGRINFDCSYCDVRTDWRPASVRNTRLLDIAFIIDNPRVTDSRTLSSRVTFTNFGTRTTPVEMTFMVLGANKKELYRTTGNTTVQTEAIYKKKFPDLVLAPGKYILVLHTLYNTNMRDEFKRPFEVVAQQTLLDLICHWAVWICLIELFVLLWLLRGLRKNKQQERRKNQI